MEKISIVTKIKNAYEMFHKEGLGSLLYKIRRRSYHKIHNTLRNLDKYKGKRLRDKAKQFSRVNRSPLSMSVIIPVLGQHDLAQFSINKIIEHHGENLEILVIDNGGDFRPDTDNLPKTISLKVITPPGGNIGVYPTYKFGMDNSTTDIVLFIHSDLIIDETDFDIFLKYIFTRKNEIGLVGFVGSDEINCSGGRGFGTTSNFSYKTHTYKNKSWCGVNSLIYGDRFNGLTNAAVIDSLAMAFRRSAWNKIEYRQNQSPHHYHDRLFSCQILEAGYKIAVLGIACDHISGQTSGGEKKYYNLARTWCEENKIPLVEDDSGNINWDWSLHEEAKRRFLKEWRDEKHFIPRQI